VAPADIEEGMRVGVDRTKYQIKIPLPPKIDATVTLMEVEEKPDVTYKDIGGAKEQLRQLREVLELPLLHPERFIQLGVDPPQGRAPVRASGDRENAVCACGCQQDGRDVYPCHWV